MGEIMSSLASVKITSPCTDGRRCYNVERITIHCMVGQLSARRCGELFSDKSYGASSNYGIGTSGEIGGYVSEEKRSWCSSSADNDNRAITIECASDAKAPYAFNSRVWASLVALCVDICKRYGKNKLLWLGDKKTSLAYKPKDNEMIITAHRWFAAKSCPGDWMYAREGKLAAEVTEKLKSTGAKGKTVAESPNTAAAVLIDNEEADREKKIWDFLTRNGLNAYAAAGLMGNLYAESALRPNNLQNSFERKLGFSDKGYTNAVNEGTYKNFVHDGAGYGLAQWTWHTRKQNLLSFARNTRRSIDDMQMQLEFLWNELQGYTRAMSILRAAKSVKEASDIVLTDFEKPADQSGTVKERRAAFGREYYDRYAKATQKPQTSTDPGRQGRYRIQFGVFSVESNAKRKAAEADTKGLSTVIICEDGFYKVCLENNFESLQEAEKAAAKARKNGLGACVKEV